MKSHVRRLVLVAAIAVYVCACIFCWRIFPDAQLRQVLGEACYPAAFSGDGRYVVTYKRWQRRSPNGGSKEEASGPIQIWDLLTGEITAAFLTEKHNVHYHAALSPDGRWLAVPEGTFTVTAGKVHIFDVITGKEHAAYDISAKTWPYVCFSSDSQWIAVNTGGNDARQVTVWGMSGDKPPLVLDDACFPFSFTPDCKQLAAAVPEKKRANADQEEIRLHELAERRTTGVFHVRNGGFPQSLALSPDGRFLCASFSLPNSGWPQSYVWDVKTNQERTLIDGASSPHFLRGGDTLMLIRQDGYFLVDTATWTQREVRLGKHISVRGGGDSESGLVVAVSSNQETLFDFFAMMFKGPAAPQPQNATITVTNVENGIHVATITRPNCFVVPLLTPDRSTLLLRVTDLAEPQSALEVWDLPSQAAWKNRLLVLALLTAIFAVVGWIFWRRGKSRSAGSKDMPARPNS